MVISVYTAENREFFIKLRRAFNEFPLVAEMRHDSWMAEEAIGTFLDYRVGFCNIDQPEYMRAMPPTAFLTSSIGYVRLHGRNPRNSLGAYERSAPRARQHDYLYSETELEQWAARIEKVGRYADSTFVIFNNDAGAKSMVNALQLQAAMTGMRATAPRELRRRYPVELERFGSRAIEQQCLFTAAWGYPYVIGICEARFLTSIGRVRTFALRRIYSPDRSMVYRANGLADCRICSVSEHSAKHCW